MKITKEILKENAKTLWETLDKITDLEFDGQTPVLRYINRDATQGIYLVYEYGYKRIGAYYWTENDKPSLDSEFISENAPNELKQKLFEILNFLKANPIITELIITGEYKWYKDIISYEIVTEYEPTEMYKDGSATTYELRLNRNNRVTQTKPKKEYYSYLVAYNID